MEERESKLKTMILFVCLNWYICNGVEGEMCRRLCNAMHVTLCYDRTRQGMVRRTARGYGNGSWKKAGRKGKEAKYTTSARHRFKETEREETRGGVRGERACRPIRGSRRHATCDMRCAIFLIALDLVGPRWTLPGNVGSTGPFDPATSCSTAFP